MKKVFMLMLVLVCAVVLSSSAFAVGTNLPDWNVPTRGTYYTTADSYSLNCSVGAESYVQKMQFFRGTTLIANVTNSTLNQSSFATTWSLSGVADGSYVMNCTALLTGNVYSGQNTSVTIVVDQTDPAITVQLPSSKDDTQWNTHEVAFKFTPSDTNIDWCRMYLDGVVVNNTVTPTTGTQITYRRGGYVENQDEKVYFWCNDSAGNSKQTSSVTFAVLPSGASVSNVPGAGSVAPGTSKNNAWLWVAGIAALVIFWKPIKKALKLK